MSSITEPLQLIHIDSFSLVNFRSMSRKRYALVMDDDFSKYTWVLFLHSKDEAPRLIINNIKNIEVDDVTAPDPGSGSDVTTKQK